MDLHALSPAESPKSVLASIWTAITARCGALCDSADGPRPTAGAGSSLRQSRIVRTW
jgi:hypothetical protein